jgi:catechol 2,3-dioxygenase-like lactoylglutathione lyase family enzyme
VSPKTLDHVALWVADRDGIADCATSDLGMHVIEQTDRFTLVGADARRGKLTLFEADPPRERGALKHVGLRVASVDRARAVVPDGGGEIELGDGLRVQLVEAPTDVDYDLDHVALLSRTPDETADAYVELGFRPAAPGASGAPRVEVGGAYLEFHPGEPGTPERPLLNHVAVLVDSADEHRVDAEERGIEVADFVDAPNTVAVFVWGPERVKLEYVEHKPTFALR